MVNGILELNENIIPLFFNKYPVLGKKQLDYLDFCNIVNLKLNKSHLTEGLNDIRSIVDGGMNSKI